MSDKKWFNYFISVESTGASQGEAPPPMDDAAKAVADIAASLGPPPAAAPAQEKAMEQRAAAIAPAATVSGKPLEFNEIYAAAEITTPPHGYTVMKVSEMLQSPHIKDLPMEVRRSSILVALDAAGVKVANIVEDAVRRDKALDAFERIQQKAADDFEAAKLDENRKLQAELDKLTGEYKARIQANTDAATKRRESFAAWRVQKQIEEQEDRGLRRLFRDRKPHHYHAQLARSAETIEEDICSTDCPRFPFLCRVLHLRRRESGADPRAEHSRHERPGAAHERVHRDGEGQRDAARKGRGEVQDRAQRR